MIKILLFSLLLCGCAFGKVSDEKVSWFIGWGKLEQEGKKIESSPPIQIGTIPTVR